MTNQEKMIKFFRKMRQNSIKDNNITHYLKYAIGEIILVVIGILIALQINNWNEDQKIKKQEILYLNNLKNDLKLQIKTLNYYIEFQNIIIQNSNVIVNHFDKNNGFYNMDSIYPRLNDLSVRTTFINNNTTLTEMINSGEINILSNNTLKRELLEYNQQVVTFMNITQNNNTNLIDLLIVPNLMKSSNFASAGYSHSMQKLFKEFSPNEEISYIKNIEVENILAEPKAKLELINNVVFRYVLATSQKTGNENLKEEAKKILHDITNELEEH